MPWSVVAYESSDFIISIPNRVILRNEEGLIDCIKNEPDKFVQTSESAFEELILNGIFQKTENPQTLGSGWWVAVDEGLLCPFPLVMEEKWRADKAQQLLSTFEKIKDPIRKIELIKAAGNLVGIEVVTLARRLSMERKPGETLKDVFTRVTSKT